MALHSHHSEKEPLLAAHSSSCKGRFISSYTLSNTHSLASSSLENTSAPTSSTATHGHYFSTLSLYTQLLIGIMVAIPTYLLASTAVTSLGPLAPRNAIIRSPQPDPVPQTTTTSSTVIVDSADFASVLGPHISTNFPDPAIIYVDGVSYAFATNNRQPAPNHINIQVATSTDNQTWTLLEGHDALPNLGAWEIGAGVWAPDVVQVVS